MNQKTYFKIFIVVQLFIIACNSNNQYYRALTSGYPNPQTFKIFPERKVETSGPISFISKSEKRKMRDALTFRTVRDGMQTVPFDEILKITRTNALIVIKENKLVYENYLNGFDRESLQTSFSSAKSILSTLIGIAIEEGKIQSVNDPVIKYIPELKNRGLDTLKIRDIMMMSTGIDYKRVEDTFFLLIPFSPDITTFYGDNLRAIIGDLHSGKVPVGKSFNYNDYYPILEGIILERVTGTTISNYTRKKLWEPMGMEFDASWSLDSEEHGFERVHVAFNARAIDFARFGLLFLNNGTWNGRKIVSSDWVQQSTSPDPNDDRDWMVFKFWPKIGGYYKYHWWGMKNEDQTYDYMARGNLGQIIFVSPSRKTVIVRLGEEPNNNYQWPFIAKALAGQLE
ncbi:beta-lactamase [Leptospira broomii serovar Hurstbridge str. 5399]|uniref:Beta-lactamase n=1 Tax=Leptospira broomii serovar Hurstbridge str. 5399 TaxID=1049789 RepID=T0FEI2_9LEPT|nr:serine hydrolase [Leptospira broomii]EQA46296.1 beta-lactamase [Leptospira broomii serovar Hurstbridge str. 5399]